MTAVLTVDPVTQFADFEKQVGFVPRRNGDGGVCDWSRVEALLAESSRLLRAGDTGIVLVLDYLLHGPARTDAEGLQLNLDHWDAVDEEDDIVAVVAVVGVDAELMDYLELVFCTSRGC